MFDIFKEDTPKVFFEMSRKSMNYHVYNDRRSGEHDCFECNNVRHNRKRREHHCFIGGFSVYRNTICDKFVK